MARYGTALGEQERILILTKTYPTPSKGYVETTCVAAVSEKGALRRIFPVPFRFLDGDKQFSRWQWITANFRSPTDDSRPESRRIDTTTLELGETIPTQRGSWYERMKWVEPHVVPSFAKLEEERVSKKQTLGFLRPSRLLGLDITHLPPKERVWSEEDRAKLERDIAQQELFETAAPKRRPLEKIPYKFHYRYEIDCDGSKEQLRHPITDWEIGALYRNLRSRHGGEWETPFRAKIEQEFAEKDLVLMMGTMH